MVKNILRILVCPLDWGLGHATRMTPVIRLLHEKKHTVIIAADNQPLEFLRSHFPDLEFIILPGHKVTYTPGRNMAIKMLRQMPGLLWQIFSEHNRLKKIVKELNIDVVISDNRFGLWSNREWSVYITHQLMIKAPKGMKWAEPLLHRVHRWFIDKYDECWIPDLPGELNFSGDLAHRYPLPSHGFFVGLLSRFEKPLPLKEVANDKKVPDLLIMLSGPEPQRSIFEKIILKGLGQESNLNAVVLRGLPGANDLPAISQNVSIFNHLPDEAISLLIAGAGLIICRSGYSSVMDLVVSERSAILIPTPGQTEQEYLAQYLDEKGMFLHIPQDDFSIKKAWELKSRLPGTIKNANDVFLLKNRVKELSSGTGKNRISIF